MPWPQGETASPSMKTWPSLPSELNQMLTDWCLWAHFSINLNSYSVSQLFFFFFFPETNLYGFSSSEEISPQLLKLPCFTHSEHVSKFLHKFTHWLMASSSYEPIFMETGYFLKKNKLIVFSTISGLAPWARVLAKIQTAFLLSAYCLQPWGVESVGMQGDFCLPYLCHSIHRLVPDLHW